MSNKEPPWLCLFIFRAITLLLPENPRNIPHLFDKNSGTGSWRKPDVEWTIVISTV